LLLLLLLFILSAGALFAVPCAGEQSYCFVRLVVGESGNVEVLNCSLLAARGFYCLGPVAVAGSGGDGNCIVLDCLLFVVAAMLVTSLFRTACTCWWWWSLYRFGLFVVGGGSGNVIVCFFLVL
jgi:hypothetical protein